MRLPHHLVSSQLFQFADVDTLLAALADHVDEVEAAQIRYLCEQGLPPVTSPEVLGVLLGLNSGLVWSLIHRPHRYYRTFTLEKGNGQQRTIHAPRVALKVIQKWLSYHIAERNMPGAHVYGFVPGKSHLMAAQEHIGAQWAYSVDIREFFQTTPEQLVVNAYHSIGYDLEAARMLARLSCLFGFLAQGAPTSPALSNICFRDKDDALLQIAVAFNCRVTRYADDVVFSGQGTMPEGLRAGVGAVFEEGPWKLAPEKELIQPIKGRIKIHGLIIKDDEVRLTKGYRNKIRAYAHVLATRGYSADNRAKLMGHVQYAEHVKARTGSPSGVAPSSQAWENALKQPLVTRQVLDADVERKLADGTVKLSFGARLLRWLGVSGQ